MSDDEYCEEFDEEDIFWIEEPDPTIADDLAATATHDANFVDDPSYEVEDFHSDWDEMSDEYYDDEPTVMRRQRVMNLLANNDHTKETNDSPWRKGTRKQGTKTHRIHHGRTLRGDIPSIRTDVASFQGVVWKTPDPTVKLYEPGNGEVVALLKNWREVFRTSNPALWMRKIGHPSPNTEIPRSRAISDLLQNGKQREDSSDRTSGMSSLDNLRDTDIGSDITSNTTPTDPVSPIPEDNNQSIELPSDVHVDSKMAELEYPVEDLENMTPAQADVKLNGSNAKKSTKSIKETSLVLPPTRSRKRKASVSLEEQPGENQNAPETATGTRSKRIASKKVGEATAPTPASSGPVRRSTRQKKA